MTYILVVLFLAGQPAQPPTPGLTLAQCQSLATAWNVPAGTPVIAQLTPIASCVGETP